MRGDPVLQPDLLLLFRSLFLVFAYEQPLIGRVHAFSQAVGRHMSALCSVKTQDLIPNF
jgi:hypothetical protein